MRRRHLWTQQACITSSHLAVLLLCCVVLLHVVCVRVACCVRCCSAAVTDVCVWPHTCVQGQEEQEALLEPSTPSWIYED